jgi:hypothetical protein
LAAGNNAWEAELAVTRSFVSRSDGVDRAAVSEIDPAEGEIPGVDPSDAGPSTVTFMGSLPACKFERIKEGRWCQSRLAFYPCCLA